MKPGSRVALLGVLLLLICANSRGSDEAVAKGRAVTTQDLKDATPVATFTPHEFSKAADDYAKSQCRKGSISATSDGSRISLDGTAYSDQEFADELVRRGKEHSIYCVEIIGPGSDVKRVSALLGRLKGTSIESLKWRPAK
jgi:hypothetical protein